MVSVVFSQNIFIYLFFNLSFFKTFFPAFSCIFFALGYKLTFTYFGRSLNTNFIKFLKISFSICQSSLFLLEIFLHKWNILSHIRSLFFNADFGFSFSFFLEKNSPHIHSGFGSPFNARSSQDAHN
jgi:hypothetical protein